MGQCQRASSGVPHASWRSGSPGPPRRDAPVGEQVQRARQLAAVGGQRVLHPDRAPAVRRRDEDPGPLEAPQPVRQDVGRDPGHRLAELVEPARAAAAAPRRSAGSIGRRPGRARCPGRGASRVAGAAGRVAASAGRGGSGGHRAMVGEGLRRSTLGSRLQITSYSPHDQAPAQRGTTAPCPCSTSSRRPSPPSRPSAAPSVVGIGSRIRGSGVVVADGARPDQRPQPPRRRGHRPLRRRPDAPRHRRRASTGTATSPSSTSTPPARRRSPGRPAAPPSAPPCSRPPPRRRAAPASRSASCRPSSGRSAAPAAAGSPARSSTPRRSRPARPGSPLLDADGALVGLNTNRVGEGFYLALPADDGAQVPRRRPRPRRVARAAAARDRGRPGARRPAAAPVGGPAGARRRPRARRRGGQPGRGGRHPGRRPAGRGGRQARPRHRRPPRRCSATRACRSSSRSSAGPRSGR